MPQPIHRTDPSPVPNSATEHLVPMRDGVRLAADVYLPAPGAGDSPLPTLLTRLPYDKDSRYVFMDRIAECLTRRGYAVVVQDVRGKFRSEGETMPFVHEAPDGYDTIEWITRQPWSDGRVGMFGDSYYGATQWAAASSRHPALRAIAPRVTGADGIRPEYWARDGITQLFGAIYYSAYWSDNWAYQFEPDFSLRPIAAVFDEIAEKIGAWPAMFDHYIPNVEPLPAFPDGHPFDGAPLPVLHMAGWFDNCLQPSINDWATLAAKADWAPLQYLNVDSIDHEGYHVDDLPIAEDNDHSVNDEAVWRQLERYLPPMCDFFDVFLKGTRAPETLPRIAWHQTHLGHCTSEQWPPAETQELRLNLAADGMLAAPTSAEAPAGTFEWVHDPDDPVPSLLLDSFSAVRHHVDESPLHARADVATFTTAPMTEPLDLAGPIRLRIAIRTETPGVPVFAKLLDLAPDGSAHVIVRGQRTIPDDGSSDKQFEIDMTHAGYRLRPGHALRLHLASSDFPTYLTHPGTGENPWLAVETKPSAQILLLGGPTPTHLSVHVLDDREC